MPLAIPKILVVADPAEQRELVSLLRGAGPPFTEAVIASGDGDDGTLTTFEELRPAVVVVAATLAAGDARALVGAMRDAAPAGVFVVLLGDADGPVRNALDAIDFGCDRFVARPVAVKALRFAVASGLGGAAGGRAGTASDRTPDVSPSQVAAGAAAFAPSAVPEAHPARVTEPMAAVRVTEPMAAVRLTEPMPAAARVTEPMAAVWGGDAAAEPAPAPRPVAIARVTLPMAAARVTAPMAAARVAASMTAVDAAVEAATPAPAGAEVTAPARAATADDRASLRARWEALADAIGAGDEVEDDAEGDGEIVLSDQEVDDLSIDESGDPRGDEIGAVGGDALRAGTTPGDEPAVITDPFRVPLEALAELADAAGLPDGDSPVVEVPPAATTAVGRVRAAGTGTPAVPRAARADDLGDGHDDEPDDGLGDELDDEPDDGLGRELDDELDDELGDELDESGFTSDLKTPPPPDSPWSPGSTDVPVAPVREPTLILSDAGAAPGAGASGARAPAEVRIDERQTRGDDHPGEWGSPSQVPATDDDDEVLADVAAGVDDDLSIDLGRGVAPAGEPPPTGGEFARELRRKMSAMAERLFRGGELPAAPVAIGPGHDHHTEIDLGGLVDDPAIARGDGFELAGGATFVGGEGRFTEAPGTVTRGTAESGEIQRGTSDAAALIARLFAAEFTGRVVFRRGAAEKVIYLEGGRPVFAASNLARDRMGELLLREGKITGDQLARCRDLVRDTGRRMGEILVERGFLKRRELLPAVRRHVEDIIYSLFAWEDGDYRLVAGDGATAERIRLSRHPAAMVLEGVRRKLDRATLERLLGPTTTVVETTDRDKLAAIAGVADLSAEERAALTAFDGSAALAEVARTTGAGLASVYPLAWGLCLLGLASTRRRGGEDDDAPALVGESDLAIDRERVRARHALVLDADYFALLGVRRDATGFEIKRAYEAARRDFAAETFPPELRKELTAELEEIAQVLDEAYHVLRDDALRASYVHHLHDRADDPREPGEAAP